VTNSILRNKTVNERVQVELQRARDGALAGLEDTGPDELSEEQVLRYVRDLKVVLSADTFMEQKTFLRSFIKKIEFEPGQIAIDYTLPLAIGKDRTFE
jgi:hypothetical protein